MKLNRTFLIFILAFGIIGIILQMSAPRRFNWIETFDTDDPNPFGCKVFDSLLAVSMPNGYTAKFSTLWQETKNKKKRNILYISDHFTFDSLNSVSIKHLTENGCKVMLVVPEVYYEYDSDSDPDSVVKARKKYFGFDVSSYKYFDINSVRRELSDRSKNLWDTIHCTNADGRKPTEYRLLRQLLSEYQVEFQPEYNDNAVKWDTLAYLSSRPDSSEKPVVSHPITIAFKRKLNKGELIVVCPSLIFTNYGILDKHTTDFVFRMMNYIADKPVTRIEDTESNEAYMESRSTPFRAIFTSRPLKWAFYMTLVVLLLFFIFTARRRQRAIPVIKSPRNHTLEFTKLIGALFYQRHDNSGLVRHKWELFASTIRQEVGVDVQSLDDDDALFVRLSERTGMAYEDIAKTIKNLRYIVLNENNITSRQMKEAIGKMNEIIKKAQ